MTVLVLDFDGTMTDAEAEGRPFCEGYLDDLCALVGRAAGDPEVFAIADTVEAELAIAALVMAVFALQDTIAFNATAQTPWATPLKIPQATWVAALAVFAVLALYEAGRLVTLLLRGDLSAIDRSYGPRGTKDELDAELADLKARGVTADIAAPGDKP